MWSRLPISVIFNRIPALSAHWNLQNTAGYAKVLGVPSLGKKAVKGKAQATAEKKVFPVETDPEKLVSYVCGSNIMKTGQDIKLQPDNEYPDWLWKMSLEKPPPVEEMDPNTLQYWRRLRKLALRRQTKMMKLRSY